MLEAGSTGLTGLLELEFPVLPNSNNEFQRNWNVDSIPEL